MLDRERTSDGARTGDGLEAELRKLERDDPKVAEAALGYNLMVERITGRTFCPICGGLGWYTDEQGRAHDCPPTA